MNVGWIMDQVGKMSQVWFKICLDINDQVWGIIKTYQIVNFQEELQMVCANQNDHEKWDFIKEKSLMKWYFLLISWRVCCNSKPFV